MVFDTENIKNLEFNEENFEELKNNAIAIIDEVKEAHTAIHDSNAMMTEQVKTLGDLNDKYLRALADYQNLQKRTVTQVSNSKLDGKVSLLKDILPIIDDFEKAKDAGEFSEGVEIIYNKFMNMLQTNNVEVINPKEGDAFDDTVEEAVAAIPNPDKEKNTVCYVQFKGYKIGDRIIRYAKVGVYV
ncbi:MAG: nucleotide exchange factor GrpE [Clostridia bacterium]|nr:nucleotide exchange factor GrpE [Clostridia bacterium]